MFQTMTRWRLLVMCLFGATACATTPTTPAAPPSCEPGALLPCAEWGRKLLREGDRYRATEAFAKACEEGDLSACMTEGELRKEAGDYNGAERPLRKVYDTGQESAAIALAEVHEARGGPRDLQLASDFRHEALALNKPATEVVFALRVTTEAGAATELSFNLQPMAFHHRRLGFGFNTVLGPPDLFELNGFGGYQHYVSPWLIPYARLMMGARSVAGGSALNVGGEAGAKVAWEDIGHINMAAGVSMASGGYFSVGLGLNGIIVLAILLQIR
ncbi:hypothetical protein OWM54_01735 [Myxococcus sp. MISCRS1]|uniref:hypothetical protein n=1 Tax=unclassified Myxococcus TaxID=2648731 RepID=UPI001CC03A79|nr:MULTISPECIES: hypothetical protein [unclassified Myxococcus]MCY0995852.1 hypothetical protein [Myxococcus sp. MISCRS1]